MDPTRTLAQLVERVRESGHDLIELRTELLELRGTVDCAVRNCRASETSRSATAGSLPAGSRSGSVETTAPRR